MQPPGGPAARAGRAARPVCGGPVLALGATQLQRACGVPAMLAAGITGTGTTIAVIVPFANPRVAYDLGVYSQRYGLPPARLKVIDYGRAPAAGGAGFHDVGEIAGDCTRLRYRRGTADSGVPSTGSSSTSCGKIASSLTPARYTSSLILPARILAIRRSASPSMRKSDDRASRAARPQRPAGGGGRWRAS